MNSTELLLVADLLKVYGYSRCSGFEQMGFLV